MSLLKHLSMPGIELQLQAEQKEIFLLHDTDFSSTQS